MIFTILIRFLLRDDRNGRPVSKQILFHSASRYYCTMLPEVKACREREAKRRAERLMRQAERDVRKEWTLYDK